MMRIRLFVLLWSDQLAKIHLGGGIMPALSFACLKQMASLEGYTGVIFGCNGLSILDDIVFEKEKELSFNRRLYGGRGKATRYLFQWSQEKGWYKGRFMGNDFPPAHVRCFEISFPAKFFKIGEDAE